MPWALVVCGDGEEPEKVLAALLDHGRGSPVEGGWLWSLDELVDDDPREAHRRRQARYRARKRDARDAQERDARDARDAQSEVIEGNFGGEDHSLSRLKAEERVSESPGVTRVTRDAGDARDGDARDARGDDNPGNPWHVELPTEAEKERAQAEIRRLREKLKATREGGNT